MKTCYFCHGKVAPGRIDYMAKRTGKYTLIRNLKADVCDQCGEFFMDPEASRLIDAALHAASASGEHISVPVVHCA